MKTNEKKKLEKLEQDLQKVMGHLLDNGKIELGTPQSKMLLNVWVQISKIAGGE